MSLNCKLLPDTEKVMECLSRMWLKSQVRFLEEGERVIDLPYSAKFHVRFLEEGERVIALSYSTSYCPKLSSEIYTQRNEL